MSLNSTIAVVGCGTWGKNIVRNFYELGCLASVYDERVELAQDAGNRYNVPVSSYDDIIKNKQIDAVAICVSAPQHTLLVSKALKAGKDVFVEKPFTLSLEESLYLHQVAQDNNKIIMVGHILQYHAAFEKVVETVHEGLIGKILSIHTTRSNLGLIRRQESVLWCLAPHDLSMILALTKCLPSDLHGCGHLMLERPHIHDWASIHMKFSNNIMAHTQVSWLNPFKEQKLTVIGEKGSISFDDCKPWEEKVCHISFDISCVEDHPHAHKGETHYLKVSPYEPLKKECEHFVESIQTRKKPKTDSLEAINVMKVLDATEKSLHSGNWIKLSQ